MIDFLGNDLALGDHVAFAGGGFSGRKKASLEDGYVHSFSGTRSVNIVPSKLHPYIGMTHKEAMMALNGWDEDEYARQKGNYPRYYGDEDRPYEPTLYRKDQNSVVKIV